MTKELNGKLLIKIIDPLNAEKLCRDITQTLPEYFGIKEANKKYAQGMRNRTSFSASYDDEDVGLLTLEFPFPNNANIYWIGVKPDYHGMQVGTHLIEAAKKYCIDHGYYSLTVETLSPKESDKNYLKTYQFYKKMGFNPLFELHTYSPDFLMVYMQKTLVKGF